MAKGTPQAQGGGLLGYHSNQELSDYWSNQGYGADMPFDAFNVTDTDSKYWENASDEEIELYEEKPWIPTPFEAQYSGEVTPAMEKSSARDERAMERARQGKMIMDPRYRRQLKEHYKQLGTYGDTGRPMLKDYKFGSGEWLKAMKDWRSTVLPNKTITDAQQSVGAMPENVQPGTVHNAPNHSAANLPTNNGAPYSGSGVSTDSSVVPGSMAPEWQDYWANVSKQAIDNQGI
tara:strand:- start:61 stop:759 length:699 start_codon:yes stop_codon:yes gene_type:complete